MSAVKYNVGDRVLVKSLDWYNENKDASGNVHVPMCFVSAMSGWCGKIVTIQSKGLNYYWIAESSQYMWSDEMFEGLADVTELFAKTEDVRLLPTSLEQCANILGVRYEIKANDGYMGNMIATLQELYMCRDAYCKLANNWIPDYTDIKTKKHCIVTRRGKLSVATTTETNRAFAFPTPEMAQKFHDSFKLKLDFCKDML